MADVAVLFIVFVAFGVSDGDDVFCTLAKREVSAL